MHEDLNLRTERRFNITATEVATLFGLNKYESPQKLIDKKRNPVQIDNNHVRRGKLKEPSVLEAFFLDMHMKTTRHKGGTICLPDHRIAATPDAYVRDTNNVVECKSVTTRNFDAWYDRCPTHYHLQVLQQMLLCNSEEGYIGALEEGDPYECEYRFVVWKMTRDARVEELIKQEVHRFWELTDRDVLFRVSSPKKKEMLELLETNAKLIYPSEKPVRKDPDDVSDILSLFN